MKRIVVLFGVLVLLAIARTEETRGAARFGRPQGQPQQPPRFSGNRSGPPPAGDGNQNVAFGRPQGQQQQRLSFSGTRFGSSSSNDANQNSAFGRPQGQQQPPHLSGNRLGPPPSGGANTNGRNNLSYQGSGYENEYDFGSPKGQRQSGSSAGNQPPRPSRNRFGLPQSNNDYQSGRYDSLQGPGNGYGFGFSNGQQQQPPRQLGNRFGPPQSNDFNQNGGYDQEYGFGYDFGPSNSQRQSQGQQQPPQLNDRNANIRYNGPVQDRGYGRGQFVY